MLKSLRERGQESKAQARETLLKRIFSWREDKAKELTIAPEAVMKENIAYRIAYSSISNKEVKKKCRELNVNGIGFFFFWIF